MKKSSRIIVVALALALVLAFGAQAALAQDQCTLTLIGVGWSDLLNPENPKTVSVLIKAGPGVSAGAIADVRTAINDWDTVLADIRAHSTSAAPDLEIVEGVRTADIVIKMKVGGGAVLGMANPRTYPNSCILKSASIQLSGKALGEPFTSEGRRFTATHELGHALGLGHSNDPQDLMYTYGDPSATQVVPISECDKDGLRAIYNPYSHAFDCSIPRSVTCDCLVPSIGSDTGFSF
ncbi:MAG TPA: matrixin family metalloprotease [Anaerolineae bacterium]|nr:matrixin family metalloprotease [Anaerolineae bacterium]